MCLGTLVMWISERLAIILCWVIDGVKQGEVRKPNVSYITVSYTS